MDKVERTICRTLLPTLKTYNFELHKEWGFFVRKQIYGFDAFLIVNQGKSSDGYFEIKVYSKIRHDCIEIPWNTLGFVYGDENQRQTCTLTLFRPTSFVILKVNIDSLNSDIATVVNEIESFFFQASLPFYKRFSNLSEIEVLSNIRPLTELLPFSIGGPLEHRAMRSLLLAKATNSVRYESVRDAFLMSTKKTLFPREKCMLILEKIDKMEI